MEYISNSIGKDICRGKNFTDKRNKTIILLMAKVRGKGGKIRHTPLDDRMLKGKNYPSLKN